MGLGMIFYEKGLYQEALAEYEKVIAQDATNAGAYFELGRCRIALGEMATAEQALAKALELRPEYPEARVALGELYIKEKEYAGAAAAFSLAAKQRENYLAAYVGLGRVFTATGEFKQAEEAFDKALLVAPNDPWVLYYAGDLRKRQGDAARARVLFEKSRANAGTDDKLRSLLSVAIDTLGN
jgi:tetratricopeptide (TPR) repeat protein